MDKEFSSDSSAFPWTYMQLPVLSACTANKCHEVAGCGHLTLAATVYYSSYVLYERCSLHNTHVTHMEGIDFTN